MRHALLLPVLAASVLACAPALQPAVHASAVPLTKVSFYFAGHEDDWQLFMNPSAFADVANANTKTVFVHVTAGDGGLGTGNGGRKHPYYLARESGARAAIRFMADAGELPAAELESHSSFHGHSVYRVSHGNTVAYFLRLPDGHGSGLGFPGTDYQSVERLASGELASIAAIDGSATYRGWPDLVGTVRAIIDHERESAAAVQLNVPDPLAGRNPGDHSDHLMTARAALEATGDLACLQRAYYVDYFSMRLPENLDALERDKESSVLAATSAGILALDHASIWAAYYHRWLGRSYFRVENGTGSCNPPAR